MTIPSLDDVSTALAAATLTKPTLDRLLVEIEAGSPPPNATAVLGGMEAYASCNKLLLLFYVEFNMVCKVTECEEVVALRKKLKKDKATTALDVAPLAPASYAPSDLDKMSRSLTDPHKTRVSRPFTRMPSLSSGTLLLRKLKPALPEQRG